MPTDHRQAAAGKISDLITLLKSSQGSLAAEMIEESEALARAVGAFHMEGIRFRIFNVDRLMARDAALPAAATSLLEDVRRHLEAAGFHTRSHHAPS